MKIKKKLVSFLQSDFRWKLIKLSKIIKINLYPKTFNLSNYAHKIIFNFIFNEKSQKIKKIISQNIIEQQKYSKKNLKFLVSPPGSGSTFVRCMLNSYFEIFYGIGNGIPKFNNITNEWIFSGSPILSSDLFNSIIIDESLNKNNTNKYFSKKEFYKNVIFFTRYPYKNSKIDLHNFNNSKIIVLFREPYDWMISQYTRYEKKNYVDKKIVNVIMIKESLNYLKTYYDFWLKYSKLNKTKVLFIDYKILTTKSNKAFFEICKFINYKISNKELINDCVKYNSKRYSLKLIKTKFEGTRFSNSYERNKIKTKISKHLNKEIKNLNFEKIYKDLLKRVVI